jgi:hypothetical protein
MLSANKGKVRQLSQFDNPTTHARGCITIMQSSPPQSKSTRVNIDPVIDLFPQRVRQLLVHALNPKDSVHNPNSRVTVIAVSDC